jgi:Reverse transcriptase (RNA-dependent DNA polymerase)
MAFGLVNAPMHFQYVIDTLLGRAGELNAVGYLDDVTTHGSKWEQVWEDTVTVLRVLTRAGFMVNLRKCQFLK